MPAIPLITAGIGAVSAGMSAYAANKQQQTQNQLTQAPQAANQAVQAAQTQLAQRKFGSDQSQLALRNSLQGGLLKGLTDAKITPPPQIGQYMATSTGGLRPSAISGGQQIGSDMQRQALLDLMQPNQASSGPMPAMSQSNDLTDVSAAGLQPGTPSLPQPGGLSKFLNFALPLAAGGVGVYDAWKKGQTPTQAAASAPGTFYGVKPISFAGAGG